MRAEWAPKRAEWLRGRECVISLMKGQRGLLADDTHEICGGSNRQKTVADIRFWLPVSRFNHGVLQYMPRARQWALKCLYDAENFDLAALSLFPGFVIHTAEVLGEIRLLRMGMKR